jgi:beta-mannosidase
MDVRFGIKKSELLQEKDKWGTGYVIKVNDRPIFCKGADYIPQDIFPARVKDADLRKMVEIMAQSNFNMVRIWGGGYYPDAAFYEACDELGIMVWQDFMFACAMYPGDSNFLQQVKEEIEFQIPRISSHPSLVIFNGNNEVDVAWKNWGFQLKYSLYGKEALEIEESYTKIFKLLIPTAVSEFSAAPYIHTSPLSNWGKDAYFNDGTQHYWGVWHGKDPLSDFGKKIGRFNAEYGFQSFPEYSTLATFSEKKDWDLESDIMKHHQKSYVGNGMILKHAKLLYGVPANFETFVYYSQLTQATAVSMAVTGHRLDAPRCMGTLYWQLNDCWPAPSWSSVDYFGNWKALQYKMKDDYEGIAVLRKTSEDGQSEYFLVSDQIDTFSCALSYTVFDLSGKELFTKSISKLVQGNGATKICLNGLKKNYFIRFTWTDAKNENKTRFFSETPLAYKKAVASDVKVYMTDVDVVAKSAILLIDNTKFLKDFWIYSRKLGIRFEQNFLDLLPGSHAIKIQFEETPILEDFEMKWL